VNVWRLTSAGAAKRLETAAISLTNASAKSLTASSSSLSVAAFIEMPTFSSVCIVSCASSRFSSRLARQRPWSRNASNVAGGIVLTVSLPISSST